MASQEVDDEREYEKTRKENAAEKANPIRRKKWKLQAKKKKNELKKGI